MALPQIPECSVEERDDGTYLITHYTTGETATADTHERALSQGMILRWSAFWQSYGIGAGA